MEVSFHSHLDSNTVIARKFCTWHDSTAVVACAKICCDLVASNGIMARLSFHRIWIADKNPLVKRAPGDNESVDLKYAVEVIISRPLVKSMLELVLAYSQLDISWLNSIQFLKKNTNIFCQENTIMDKIYLAWPCCLDLGMYSVSFWNMEGW